MNSINIAYFVTHHGLGHAGRSAAVMAAVQRHIPGARFEIFTTCPQWFFQDSLQVPFGYHWVQADVGFIQSSPLEEDVAATCSALDRWLPFGTATVDALAAQLAALNCRMVVCDISPLGIVAARKAGLPSVLVENFTWDWIYGHYTPRHPQLDAYARQFKAIYQQVDVRIQTEPFCEGQDHTPKVPPIYRWPRIDRKKIRMLLGIPPEAKVVLVSMGGMPDRFEFLNHLPRQLAAFLVVPGADRLSTAHPRVKLLPSRSCFYHPDLLNAADVLVGKAGYSTIAEASHTGLPFGYILRPQFPESVCLERFVHDHMHGREIAPADHLSGRWLDSLTELLSIAPSGRTVENGAFQTARLLQGFLC